MRQLRLPRGVRVGPGDRRARARGAASATRGVAAAVAWSAATSTTITAQTVYEAAKQGDALASEVVRDTARFLGAGDREPAQHLQPRRRRARGRRDAGGRRAVRAAARRSAAPRVQAGGRGVPDRAGQLPVTAGVVGAVATFKAQTSRGACDAPSGASASSARFVWDVIHGRDPRDAPVEEWGGITYALRRARRGAAGRLGDRADHQGRATTSRRARASSSRALRRIAPDAALDRGARTRTTAWSCATTSDERRSEQPHRRRARRGAGSGSSRCSTRPRRALHQPHQRLRARPRDRAARSGSTFAARSTATCTRCCCAVQPDGLRTPQPLPNVAAWCRCFDLLQVNEDEMAMMAPDPMALAATALATGVRCLARDARAARRGVLRGARASSGSPTSRARAPLGAALGPDAHRAGSRSAERRMTTGDPTGCGDVWGATYFSRLLAGDKLADAMRRGASTRPRATSSTGAPPASPTTCAESSASRDHRHQRPALARRPAPSSRCSSSSRPLPPDEKILVDARHTRWASPYGLPRCSTLAQSRAERPGARGAGSGGDGVVLGAHGLLQARRRAVRAARARCRARATAASRDVLLEITPIAKSEDVHEVVGPHPAARRRRSSRRS